MTSRDRRPEPSAARSGLTAGGRPRPPAPPPGPISRVATRAPAPIPPPLPIAQPPGSRAAFGIPNLRRNVCPHFYVTNARGPIPIQAPHLLKALMRYDVNVARCQLRGGVHLEQGYVSDICLSSRFNQCVSYEDELTRR